MNDVFLWNRLKANENTEKPRTLKKLEAAIPNQSALFNEQNYNWSEQKKIFQERLEMCVCENGYHLDDDKIENKKNLFSYKMIESIMLPSFLYE